ncbi:MAG TPA: DUF835 domain-containing protein [Thermoplasmata archaeon]|nr:DUF835 domain-containing protein [Thermoplasmata archaeon]
MVDEALWYSLISVAASALSLGLAAYVLRSIPNRRAGDLFVLAMAFFFVSGVLAFVNRVTEPGEWSLVLARMFYFAHTMTVGYVMSFLGAYFYGFQFFRRRTVSLGMQLLLLFAAIYVASQVQEVVRVDPYGTYVETRAAVRSLAIFAALFSLTGLATLLRTIRATRDAVVRKQATVMLAGLLVHVAGAGWYALTRLTPSTPPAYPPPLLTVTALGMASAFALAILRYRMFTLTAGREEPEETAPWVDLRPSKSYLVKDKSKHRAFTVLADAARHGRQGLGITRANPAAVRQEYGLRETPIVWLTTIFGQNQVPPTDLALLEKIVLQALKDAANPVVLLDGVEYLLVYNKFERVIRFFHTVRDATEAAGGSLVLALDTSVLEEREAALFESELAVLEPPNRGDSVIEDVFVIDRAGLLLVHNTRRLRAMADHDQLAALLTAIENFARDAFRGTSALKTLDVGERKLAIERGEKLLIAVVYSGAELAGTRREMRSFLARAERRFGDLLERWDGDVGKMEPLKVMTNRLLA